LNTYLFLNLLSAIFILVSVAIPILLSTKLSGKIRQLTIFLSVFIIIHGSYHVAVMLGYEFIGAGILDPLSVVVLIAFGLFYLNLMQTNERARRQFKS
jgi:DMSO/TMAO reductase YedYZ heme-binding membrane subunit